MQENFAAQLIVPSGYLRRSETGFGGGFVALFWHFVLWFVSFLIHCSFIKYSKIQPWEHLEKDYFVFQ